MTEFKGLKSSAADQDMDQALYDYLLKLGFEDDDIQFLCVACPGLENISAERALQNIATVVRYGYPQEDLDGLIAVNPSFLLNNPTDLEQILVRLGKDVEEKLKDNPHLI